MITEQWKIEIMKRIKVYVKNKTQETTGDIPLASLFKFSYLYIFFVTLLLFLLD